MSNLMGIAVSNMPNSETFKKGIEEIITAVSETLPKNDFVEAASIIDHNFKEVGDHQRELGAILTQLKNRY